MNLRQFYTGRAIGFVILLVLVGIVAAFFALNNYIYQEKQGDTDDGMSPVPYEATISGQYVCLPHVDTTGPQTEECAFGLKTDAGEYYAVNFGQSADAMQQFQSGAHIRAEGFIVIKEALSTDHWQKYDMEGIFTITRMLETVGVPESPVQQL
ncbi:hypothetical protein HYT05_00090 [Candidatus Kaiserbacteria bacterium]|nr:hypothetical protein [Candidatus Kaiserbacteria bacterium]